MGTIHNAQMDRFQQTELLRQSMMRLNHFPTLASLVQTRSPLTSYMQIAHSPLIRFSEGGSYCGVSDTVGPDATVIAFRFVTPDSEPIPTFG